MAATNIRINNRRTKIKLISFKVKMSAEFSAKILDFLRLMNICYQKEMSDKTSTSLICKECQSSICRMVQEGNPGLDCFTVYAKDRDQIYKYWYTAKVIPSLPNDPSEILRASGRTQNHTGNKDQL